MKLVVLPLIFCCLFSAIWTLAVYGVANLGGWSTLAGSFTHMGHMEPEGDRFAFQSFQFGLFGRYSRVVTAVVHKDGLYLAPMYIFSFGRSLVD